MQSYDFSIMRWGQFQTHCKHVGDSPPSAKRWEPECKLASAGAGWKVECCGDNCPVWENFQITPLHPLYEEINQNNPGAERVNRTG